MKGGHKCVASDTNQANDALAKEDLLPSNFPNPVSKSLLIFVFILSENL